MIRGGGIRWDHTESGPGGIWSNSSSVPLPTKKIDRCELLGRE